MRPGRSDCAPCHRDREKARYHANREAQIAAAVKWQRDNKDRRREYFRAWMATNRKGKAVVTGDKKRDAMTYIALIKNDPCVYCGKPCEHIDHIVPVASGGSGEWDNLAPTCQHCNQSKNARSVLRFMLARLETAA